jgi:hypothetical protein
MLLNMTCAYQTIIRSAHGDWHDWLLRRRDGDLLQAVTLPKGDAIVLSRGTGAVQVLENFQAIKRPILPIDAHRA